jgi:hypothetical protein
MKQKNTIIEALQKELPLLSSKYGVRRIGVFGSFAKGTQKKDSDIDLVIEFKNPIGFKFIELADHLEAILGIKADILTPAGIKGIRIKRIAQDIKGSIIYV